jgi:hypothetical protein
MHDSNPITVQKTVENTISNHINSLNPPKYVSSKNSNDTFFKHTIPYLYDHVPIDNILNQLCYPFTREDLKNDPTLQRICGCHLSRGHRPNIDTGLLLEKDVDCVSGCHEKIGGHFGPSGPIPSSNCISKCENAKDILHIDDCHEWCEKKLTDCIHRCPTNHAQQPNQYPYGVTVNCDPICWFADTLENKKTPHCDSSVCILDDVTINLVKSKGDVSLNTMCGDNNDGTCYIHNVDISEFDSAGDINLKQQCGACYTFNDKVSADKAQLVDCATLHPISDPGTCGADCTSDSDCTDSNCSKCVNSKCANKSDPIGHCHDRCDSDSDCKSSDCPKCISHICQSTLKGECHDHCESDSDCTTSDCPKCVNSMCVANTKKSDTDTDQPSGTSNWIKTHKLAFGFIVGGATLLLLIILIAIFWRRR